jgi:hypothetical protein
VAEVKPSIVAAIERRLYAAGANGRGRRSLASRTVNDPDDPNDSNDPNAYLPTIAVV